jgi:hypothetical protein
LLLGIRFSSFLLFAWWHPLLFLKVHDNNTRVPPAEANGRTNFFRRTIRSRLLGGESRHVISRHVSWPHVKGSAHSTSPQLGSALSFLSLTHVSQRRSHAYLALTSTTLWPCTSLVHVNARVSTIRVISPDKVARCMAKLLLPRP